MVQDHIPGPYDPEPWVKAKISKKSIQYNPSPQLPAPSPQGG